MKTLADNLDAVAGALGGIVAYKAVTLFASMAVQAANFAVALRDAAAAGWALDAALRANFIGAIATLIGLAVAALITFRDRTVDVGGATVTVGEIAEAAWTAISGFIGNSIKAVGYRSEE